MRAADKRDLIGTEFHHLGVHRHSHLLRGRLAPSFPIQASNPSLYYNRGVHGCQERAPLTCGSLEELGSLESTESAGIYLAWEVASSREQEWD